VEPSPAYAFVRDMCGPHWICGAARIEGDDVVRTSRSEPFNVYLREKALGRSVVDDLRLTRDAADVRHFVQRWGLLLYGPDAEQGREPLMHWFVIADELQLILDLYGAQRASIATRDPDTTDKLRRLLRERGLTGDRLTSEEDLGVLDAERLADCWIAALLESGLERVRPGVGIASMIQYPINDELDIARGQPGHYFHVARFSDLIGYAYHTIAQHVWARAETFACVWCGAMNIRQHGNQRYCPSRCESAAKEARRPGRNTSAARQEKGRRASSMGSTPTR
jgi:hypothetical protein